MPVQPSHLPTHVERIVLQELLTGELSSAKLRPTSRRIIEKLIAKGWIERGRAPRITASLRLTRLRCGQNYQPA